MSPYFFSLDGIDGTGKSTQIRLLAEWIERRGHRVVVCTDPGGTPLGQQLRDILLGHPHEISLMAEAMLFMASRAELVEHVIRPALNDGAIVLSDRFLLANVVYQGHAGGLNVDDLWHIGRISSGGLEPALTIVLDLPVDEAQLRRGRAADRLENREREYHERVRAGFLAEARQRPDRIVVVDASASIDSVHSRICAEVERVLVGHSRA